MHGLCTLGIATKLLLEYVSSTASSTNSEPASLGFIKVRFVKHVYPGESLELHIWKSEKENIFHFILKVVERNEIVLGAAIAQIKLNAKSSVENIPIPSKALTGVADDLKSEKKSNGRLLMTRLNEAFQKLDSEARQSITKKVIRSSYLIIN